ncbi:glycoside hydrolase 43 family protein [Streptomyces sp. NPDC016845]|uniref:glycoside hydrolase 43 family protein n=1 Tax=Streptomyces sp. NPDC016845 TaxID=3364972 RepID=UPI0037B589D1
MSWTNTMHSHSRRQALAAAAGLIAGTAVPGAASRAHAASAPTAPRSAALAPAAYANPVIWQDFADIDIIRVGDTYYCSASTMHYSPGAPVLRSYNLVDWEFAGHSVPVLDFGAKYDLDGARGYVRGIWASSLNYRPSDRTFYWLGQIDFAKTYIYTAPAAEGPWTRHTTLDNAYYDAGLLIDDDDTLYVAHGNTTISVAQLSPDARTEVRDQPVFTTPADVGVLEGSRFYKIDGNYYIFVTRPANGQYVLRSTSGPYGPYEMRQLLLDLPGPIPGGGVPHQGGLVRTQNGDWYYMAFVDAYPGGRMPALAPVTWTTDGWPTVQLVDGAWGTTYPAPALPPPPRQVAPLTGPFTDTFAGPGLAPRWEWNHNPDNSKWSTGKGLHLRTATVTGDLYAARNTLTHRIQGPSSTATITLDHQGMRDGDRAGLALLRDSSAWIGLRRDGGTKRLVMTSGLTMDDNWNTTGTGQEIANTAIRGNRVWLRATADIRPDAGREGHFSYSTDGVTFTPLGTAFVLKNDWQFFMGYRFALFNYATRALGGSVNVRRFELATP